LLFAQNQKRDTTLVRVYQHFPNLGILCHVFSSLHVIFYSISVLRDKVSATPIAWQQTQNAESIDKETCKALLQPSKHCPLITNARPLNIRNKMMVITSTFTTGPLLKLSRNPSNDGRVVTTVQYIGSITGKHLKMPVIQ